ncbi:hypothetical protein AEST_10610 [Alishewanella aestuarii B11]|uniref:Uncharacterized protein n=1 Tax=Alishewanella aestuarii B11 TaxID=1197174 RepID=J2IGT9_9ALTE|nr:hypothetical protein AEST_10610 [Alishewanella aestuarii B11]
MVWLSSALCGKIQPGMPQPGYRSQSIAVVISEQARSY